MYKTSVNQNDAKHSMFSIVDIDRDIELSVILKKAFSVGFNGGDILNLFGLLLGKKTNQNTYIHNCPKCLGENTFFTTVGTEDITFVCSKCECQKKHGNSLIELINLYMDMSRREILLRIKRMVSSRLTKPTTFEMRKKLREKFNKDNGISKLIPKK